MYLTIYRKYSSQRNLYEMIRHGKRTDIVFYQNKEKYKKEGDMRWMRMGEYRSLNVWENMGK